MTIKEIKKEEFNEYASNHILKNFYQTSYYGNLMDNAKYSAMYIGAYEDNELVSASLILHKFISPAVKYGYAPRGFLIDYGNLELLKDFTVKLKSFLLIKGFAFVKINPEIIYAKVDYEGSKKIINTHNKELVEFMINMGYEKLKDNLYFESMLPKFNPIINLKSFSKESVNEICKEKINSTDVSSLKLKKCTINELPLFYNFIDEKINKTLKYFKDFYASFDSNELIDLLMVEIDYSRHAEIYKNKYEKLLMENEEINELFSDNPSDTELLNKKMNSDNELTETKHIIDTLTSKIRSGILKELIGGALLVKYNTRVNLIISGFDNNLVKLDANYFLYYNFITYYKSLNYSFLDLNGISGNFTPDNPFKSLNEFKLSFNPTVYEYIGEFDLVINNSLYNMLWSSGKLEKEFMN